MQVTACLGGTDRYLNKLVDEQANRKRMSRSAVILSILEHYFERHNRLGEVLVALGTMTAVKLGDVLDLQEDKFPNRALGEVLISSFGVEANAIDRALAIQSRYRMEFALI